MIRHPTMSLIWRFIVCGWALGFFLASYAVDAQTTSTLAPTGVLRVGVYLGSPTSLIRHPQTGQPAGLAHDLGYALGKKLGVGVTVVQFSRVAQVIDAIKSEQVNITFTNASHARAKEINFTSPLIQHELGLLVAKNSPIKNIIDADLSSICIGISQGSSSQTHCRKK
ncbi:MAG: transporter substrate-binding domain-containing protein [Limnohabitans sp.]|nr:transporter substrate-binding domain-containing protein [Limnohabitans sp.]